MRNRMGEDVRVWTGTMLQQQANAWRAADGVIERLAVIGLRPRSQQHPDHFGILRLPRRTVERAEPVLARRLQRMRRETVADRLIRIGARREQKLHAAP